MFLFSSPVLSLSGSHRLIRGNLTYSNSKLLTAQAYLSCSQKAAESEKSTDLGLISLKFKMIVLIF